MIIANSGAGPRSKIPPRLITADHIKQLIRGQKNSRVFYIVVLAAAVVVSVVLFYYLLKHNLLKTVGPVLGNLTTFVSGFFPAKEITACSDRITKLKVTADLLRSVTPGTEAAKKVEDIVLENLKNR
jgi:hypothetical protein